MTDVSEAWRDPTRFSSLWVTYQQTPEEVDEARRAMAEAGLADATDPERAAGIVRWVHERMRPGSSMGPMGQARSVQAALERGVGNCTTYTAVTCFFLRANGIAARGLHEESYTRFSLLRLPTAFLGAIAGPVIGPTVNNHVWLEARMDDKWIPADAELGVFGFDQWTRARLVQGTTWRVRIAGVPYKETWPFPLRIRVMGERRDEEDDLTEEYLVERLAQLVDMDSPDGTVWADGVRYFAREFHWRRPFPGFRLLAQAPRLRRMEHALRRLLAHLEPLVPSWKEAP